MLKRSFLILGLLAAWIGVQTGSFASDWVDDDRSVFRLAPAAEQSELPPVAPPHNQPKHLAQGMLTGQATMTGSMSVNTPLVPRYGANAGANLGAMSAEADRFLLNGATDNVVQPSTMRGWLQRSHPEFNLSAQNTPLSVVEVKGAWDNSGQILNNLGIRHFSVKARQLRDVDLNSTRVLIINCEGKIPEDQWERIRQWVVRGGYLISTDWTLHSFLEKAFPGMVAWNGGNTPGTTVDGIVVANDRALLQGLPVRRATWKLDEQSQTLSILRPDVVRVLVRSNKVALQDMRKNRVGSGGDINQQGVLACDFPYGRGRVLHLVGHFDYNSPLGFRRDVLPDAVPGLGVGLRQGIATNFLLQGLSKNR